MAKTKMYRAVLKEMETGNYKQKADPVYEELYQESKDWKLAKPPQKMKINHDIGICNLIIYS